MHVAEPGLELIFVRSQRLCISQPLAHIILPVRKSISLICAAVNPELGTGTNQIEPSGRVKGPLRAPAPKVLLISTLTPSVGPG